MSGIFGFLGILLTVAVIAFVVKSQITSLSAPVRGLQTTPTTAPAPDANASAPTVRDQAKLIQQQYKDAVEAAMKTHPEPDDSK